MSHVEEVWERLNKHVIEVTTLSSVQGLLHWDQQTQMPPAAAGLRASQNALMARMVHSLLTDPQYGADLEALKDIDEPFRAAAVAHQLRDYTRNTCLSADLVDRLARAQAEGFEAWMAARKANDFSLFAPALRTLVQLHRDKAAAIDASRHPYDVLLDGFDYGTSIATLKPMFARLQQGLSELVAATRDAAPLPRVDVEVDVDLQHELHQQIIRALGYDLEAGRLDAAEHPFTIGLGQGDVRITTHLYPNDLLNGLSGTVHEAGHAMYEQGLPHSEWAGSGLNAAASYGLHESQSRFWENAIGGSLPFMQWFSDRLAERDIAVPANTLYRAANRIEPSLIRTEADEVTYNLHIIVRFEIELALFDGTLDVDDVPQAWDDAMQRVLGVRPSSASQGALQDVHWSGGAFAYFPSYTLGNLYAASLLAAIRDDLPELWEHVGQGHFAPILSWLREKVHRHGSRLSAPEIMKAAVGPRDHVEDLLASLWARHGVLYDVQRP